MVWLASDCVAASVFSRCVHLLRLGPLLKKEKEGFQQRVRALRASSMAMDLLLSNSFRMVL